jgi:hypothetical protein
MCHLGPKLKIFHIWVPKLARLYHLGPELMIYSICIPKLAWYCHLGPKLKILYWKRFDLHLIYETLKKTMLT